MQEGLALIILAAGKGARMKSPLAKVLQPLAGKPLLRHALDTVKPLGARRSIVVVGFQAQRVMDEFADPGIEFVEQKEQLGTGHAAQQTEPALQDFDGCVLILCGDMPLIKSGTLERLIQKHEDSKADCTMLILKSETIKDFGRIVRDGDGNILKIVERKDATEEEKTIDELNAGIYCFRKKALFNALAALDNNNVQREYYLTDTIEYLVRTKKKIESIHTRDADEIFGINSKEDLERAERFFQAKGLSH